MIVLTDRHLLWRYYGNPPPILSPELEQCLLEYYASDIASLEKQLSRDLSHWREPNQAGLRR